MTPQPFSDRPSAPDRRLLTTPPHTPRPFGVTRAVSPAVESARRDGGDALWARATHGGTPLIEDDPHDDDLTGGHGPARSRLFTWLHRGPARRVALVAGKLTDDTTLDDVLFEQIAGTGLWALTLRLPAGWRGSYGLAVDDGSPGHGAVPHLAERRRRALAATDPARHHRLADWYDLLALARPDPLASEVFRGASVAAGPAAPAAPTPPQPAGRGRLSRIDITSASGGTRRATWYVPPAAKAARGGAKLVVMLDGDRRLDDGGAGFDAWAQAHLSPGTAALLLGHGDMASRDADLTCNPDLISDLRDLVGAAPVPLTEERAGRAIQGSSLGGLSALYAQCVAPDLFGVSICQSPSLWWPNARSGHAAEWLTGEIARSDVRLGSVHLSVGSDEWVLAGPVRRMRDVLAERTDLLDEEEFAGGHEAACWEAALPSVLSRLGFGAA